MHLLDQDYTDGIYADQTPPCLSLYQPTHRSFPENQQDPIRYRNLVKGLEKSLLKKYDAHKTKQLLEPFVALAEDTEFWNHSGEGLVVLGAPDFFRAYRIQRSVKELVVVADSFHLKPLLRILQSADRYHVLALSRKDVKLYEGNRDGITPVTLTPAASEMIDAARGDLRKVSHVEVSTSNPGAGGLRGGQGTGDATDNDIERYFRAVDRAILEHYSRPSGLPLVLAALPDNFGRFLKISKNPFLAKKGIEANPESLSVDAIKNHAWEAMKSHHSEGLAGIVSMFNSARSNELGDDDLERVMKAAVEGRVAILLIEADRQIPGRCDLKTGEIELDDLDNPEVDDLLDDLGEKVLNSGGQILVVPKEKMPTTSGLAAVYRF